MLIVCSSVESLAGHFLLVTLPLLGVLDHFTSLLQNVITDHGLRTSSVCCIMSLIVSAGQQPDAVVGKLYMEYLDELLPFFLHYACSKS